MPVRYLILDVDDTLTVEGRLHATSLSALSRAADAGLEVILNTGRSAGWGAALLAYLPGVSAVVVENGGAWFDRRLPPIGGVPAECPVVLRLPEGPAGPVRPRLAELRARVSAALGLALEPTADDPFRLTDHTVVRAIPGGTQGAAALAELRAAVEAESGGQAQILASSVHIHFFIDGPQPRSKAAGAAALLARRGALDPDGELASAAVAIGDSGNDASFFVPGRFALSVGVRNIERYLPELGDQRPAYITEASEGHGLSELVDELLSGRLGL